MNLEAEKYLLDILESIDIINKYLQRIPNLTAYKSDIMHIDAIERRISIIGEALNQAYKKEDLPNISNKVKIIGLRHIVIHDYDLVDHDTIWIICNKYLPILKAEIETILSTK